MSSEVTGTLTEAKYGLDCELGQFDTTSHKLKNGKITLYDTGNEFFEPTASRERFKSSLFKEMMLKFATFASTRVSTDLLNRIRHEEKGTIVTTHRNIVESEGTKIQEHIEKRCDDVLKNSDFTLENGVYEPPREFKSDESEHISQPIIEKASIATGVLNYNAKDYEFDAVNVSIDDIGVKRQTETRPKDELKEQPKRVQTTVAHVQHGKKSYILSSDSVGACLRLILGLLIFNGLLQKQIVIFDDGAKSINSAILKMFPFLNYKIILDWYHLEKKFYEQLGMALKGAKIKNEFLKDKLLPCLWFGNVDGAIKALLNIDPKMVRNPEIITYLIGYLERVRGYIPCYAMRKKLGLRNSSGIGEKCNDITVAKRQKHNGMSWSNSGSISFGAVAATTCNGQIENWIHNREISLELNRAA